MTDLVIVLISGIVVGFSLAMILNSFLLRTMSATLQEALDTIAKYEQFFEYAIKDIPDEA